MPQYPIIVMKIEFILVSFKALKYLCLFHWKIKNMVCNTYSSEKIHLFLKFSKKIRRLLILFKSMQGISSEDLDITNGIRRATPLTPDSKLPQKILSKIPRWKHWDRYISECLTSSLLSLLRDHRKRPSYHEMIHSVMLVPRELFV